MPKPRKGRPKYSRGVQIVQQKGPVSFMLGDGTQVHAERLVPWSGTDGGVNVPSGMPAEEEEVAPSSSPGTTTSPGSPALHQPGTTTSPGSPALHQVGSPQSVGSPGLREQGAPARGRGSTTQRAREQDSPEWRGQGAPARRRGSPMEQDSPERCGQVAPAHRRGSPTLRERRQDSPERRGQDAPARERVSPGPRGQDAPVHELDLPPPRVRDSPLRAAADRGVAESPGARRRPGTGGLQVPAERQGTVDGGDVVVTRSGRVVRGPQRFTF